MHNPRRIATCLLPSVRSLALNISHLFSWAAFCLVFIFLFLFFSQVHFLFHFILLLLFFLERFLFLFLCSVKGFFFLCFRVMNYATLLCHMHNSATHFWSWQNTCFKFFIGLLYPSSFARFLLALKKGGRIILNFTLNWLRVCVCVCVQIVHAQLNVLHSQRGQKKMEMEKKEKLNLAVKINAWPTIFIACLNFCTFVVNICPISVCVLFILLFSFLSFCLYLLFPTAKETLKIVCH